VKIYKYCLTFGALVLFLINSRAQEREYAFGLAGNPYFFRYICYAPDNDYATQMRPFIFILGPAGKTASETFQTDTLKNIPQFHKYYLVYVPKQSALNGDLITYIEALASLLTYNFHYGHKNLFLYIQDPAMTFSEAELHRLTFLFNSINQSATISGSVPEEKNLTELFKEDATVFKVRNEEEVKKEDFAIYYYEEDESSEEDYNFVQAKKQYFGPPAGFNFTLTGQIKDKSSGEALPFATIMVRGTTLGAVTNADGYFTIMHVPCDTNVLVIQYVGYNTTDFYLTPYTNKKNLIIEVRSSAKVLKTVNIIGSKDEVVLANKTDISTVKMTPRKMEQLPSFGEKDIMRSLQLLPGISASNESSSGLYVRGGTPDQNLVLFDGFTIYHVDHLYGFYSAFNINAVKDVQLYKGGFESKFGGRISSVTEITGKDGNQNMLNVGLDVSLLSVNAYLEVPIAKKFTSIIAFRRSYQGILYNNIFEKFNKHTHDNQVTPQNGPGGRQSQNTTVTSYFYDLNGKFTFRPNDNNILSLSIFNGMDKLDNGSGFSNPSFGGGGGGFNMNSTDLTKYGNLGASLKWSRKLNEKLYRNAIISYSNYFSDRDRSQERNTTNSSGDTLTTTRSGVFENNDLKDYSFKSDYQLDISSAAQLQFGAFGTWFDIKYNYAQNDTSSLIDKENQALLAGGYLQSRIKLFKDKLKFLPGLRISYFEPTGKLYFEPRVSVSYNLTDHLIVKGATGLFYQFVNRVTREDIMSGSKDFWLLADGGSIPVSSAIHYDLGLIYESPDYIFSAEAYYKKIDQLTEYSLRINSSPMGVSYAENFYNGYGYARGLEFLAQKKSGKFNGWLSYTLGEARNHFDVYSDMYYPANQDVTHEFKAVAMYKIKRWDFSATWIYATGRPYTAPSGAYTITLLDGTTQDFFTVTSKNGVRLPAYHRADISVNYKLLFGARGDQKRRELGYIGFSLFNLYNRKNVWYKEFTIEDGVIIETNVNYMGLTPNLILSLKLR
jgi:ferric enterobactin receptor